MLNSRIKNKYRPASEEIALSHKGCLNDKQVADMLGDAFALLAASFDNHVVAASSKRALSKAIKHLSRWCRMQDPSVRTFSQCTSQMIGAFLSGYEKQPAKTLRSGLVQLFDALVQAGQCTENPAAIHKVRQQKDTSIPLVFANLGGETANILKRFFDDKSPHWDKPQSKTSIHLVICRDFSQAMERKGITRLDGVRINDVQEYLEQKRNIRTRSQYASCLRQVAQTLLAGGIIQDNPFVRAYHTPHFKMQKTEYITSLARASGPACVAALDAFFVAKSSSSHHHPALNHFAQWMQMFGGVTNLSHITYEHLLIFREEGLAMFRKSTKQDYFSCVTQFFDYLHDQKIVQGNPASEFRQGKRHAYIARKSFLKPETAISLMRIKRVRQQAKPASRREPGLCFRSIDQQSYEQRYMFAVFVDYVTRCDKFLKHDRIDKRLPSRPHFARNKQLHRVPLSEGFWQKAQDFGAIVVEAGVRRYSNAFIESYNADDSQIKIWAKTFLAEHQASLAHRMRQMNITDAQYNIA